MATFSEIHTKLLAHSAPLLPPPKPISAALTSQISDLLLHPTLEAALHLLNLDLPSAHFLVRHMQSPPAFEGMFLHGILHRIEGDYDNARAWYSDVMVGDVYKGMWGEEGMGWKEWKESGGEKNAGQLFLDDVQKFKEGKDEGKKKALEETSRREIDHVINFCKEKFGTGKYEDASDAWVKNSEEIQKMSDDQVNGDSGRRKF